MAIIIPMRVHDEDRDEDPDKHTPVLSDMCFRE